MRHAWLWGLLLGVGCQTSGAAKGAGDYWCVVGDTADAPRAGRCAVTQEGCQSHVAAANNATLRCAQTRTLLYEVRWNGPYGPMEAFYVDVATCEREARTFWKTNAACEPAPLEGRGRRAH